VIWPSLFNSMTPQAENNPERSLPEQIEFAYLTLLRHVEGLLGEVTEMIAEKHDENNIKYVHGSLLRMTSKNARLKHKLYMLAKEKV